MTKIFVTTKHSGKMTGLCSINTSTHDNEFCKKRNGAGIGVCKHCYANRYESLRPSVRECYKRNGDILSGGVLVRGELPFINAKICRLHSYGELINEAHMINFVNICLKNPDTLFVLWTKRFNIINGVFKTYDKPENLKIIYSAPSLDKIMHKIPQHCDATFNVVTRKYAEENNLNVNCGHAPCIECQNCYSKNVKCIIEVVK